MLHRAVICVALVICPAIFSRGAHAQEASSEGTLSAEQLDEGAAEDMERAARALFQAGSVAFDQGRYEDALRHFSEAYKLAPERHLLLYNVASSYDRLRRDREALEHFDRYLEAEPNPVNKPAILARVKLLREAVARLDKAEEEKRVAEAEAQRTAEEAARAQAQREETEDQPASSEPKNRKKVPRYVTYLGAGLTVAAAGAGVAMLVLAQSDLDSYDEFRGQEPLEENLSQAQSLKDSGEMKSTVAVAALGVAGAAALATGLIAGLFTDWKSKEEGSKDVPPSASVWFGPRGAAVEYRHAF